MFSWEIRDRLLKDGHCDRSTVPSGEKAAWQEGHPNTCRKTEGNYYHHQKKFPGAMNILSAFALIGEGGKKKKSPQANPQRQINTRRGGFVPWLRCGLLEKQTQTNQFSQLIPTPVKAGGLSAWKEHAQKQTPNPGLQGTPGAPLGLACLVGAAERGCHRPGIPIARGK